jgi:hypothetical protein
MSQEFDVIYIYVTRLLPWMLTTSTQIQLTIALTIASTFDELWLLP